MPAFADHEHPIHTVRMVVLRGIELTGIPAVRAEAGVCQESQRLSMGRERSRALLESRVDMETMMTASRCDTVESRMMRCIPAEI